MATELRAEVLAAVARSILLWCVECAAACERQIRAAPRVARAGWSGRPQGWHEQDGGQTSVLTRRRSPRQQVMAYLRRKLPAILSLIVGILVGLLFAQSFGRSVSWIPVEGDTALQPASHTVQLLTYPQLCFPGHVWPAMERLRERGSPVGSCRKPQIWRTTFKLCADPRAALSRL